MARIVLAYAATGKSHAAATRPDSMLDMVSMPYKYHLPDGEPALREAEASKGAYAEDESAWNMEWPGNYVEAVEREADSGRWEKVLCPSDTFVMQSLLSDGYEVDVVVPDISLKEEYRRRFEDRGSVRLIGYLIDDGTWEDKITLLEGLCDLYGKMGKPVTLVKLGAGRYLSDVL